MLKGLHTDKHFKRSSLGRPENGEVPLSSGTSPIQPEGAPRVEKSLIALEDEVSHPLLPVNAVW